MRFLVRIILFYRWWSLFTLVSSTPIRGINWFGLETHNRCLLGLHAQSMDLYLSQLQFYQFNTIRLPVSLELMINDPLIQYDWLVTANPQYLYQPSSFLIHDLFQKASFYNISIIVDMHRLRAGVSSPLWYTEEYPEDILFKGYELILQRYGQYPNFMGLDLFNEPHGNTTWGSGNLRTDYRLFIERVLRFMDEVYYEEPFYLLINGIDWGKNLTLLAENPLRIPTNSTFGPYLRYSPHLYGPSINYIPSYQKEDLYSYWDRLFGFIPSNQLWIGEWGGRWSDELDALWIQSLIDYLKMMNIQHHFYWALNPDSKDVDGLLEMDWYTVRRDVMSAIEQI